ncbi:hypothetical protein BH10BAC4_BH10BAC4_23290 [soil metagenome]
MELDEMKSVWTEMSAQLEKQKRLTDKLIINMTQERYRTKLSKISTLEVTSSVICIVIAILILLNYKKYDSSYLVVSAIISAVLLIIMPVISVSAINKMSNLNIIDNNLKQILTDYAKRKNNLLFIQKISYFLGFILLVAILPVMVKIMGGKEVPMDSTVWFWYLPLGFLFFIAFSRRVYGYYIRTTIRLENLLKDLEE